MGLSKLTRARQIVFCWLLSTQSRGHCALCKIQNPNNWKILLVQYKPYLYINIYSLWKTEFASPFCWIQINTNLSKNKTQICPQMRFPKKESVTHLNRQLQIQEMLAHLNQPTFLILHQIGSNWTNCPLIGESQKSKFKSTCFTIVRAAPTATSPSFSELLSTKRYNKGMN